MPGELIRHSFFGWIYALQRNFYFNKDYLELFVFS